MTITIKNLTLKNFLSIGQVTQAINFDCTDLTLILGENLDLGGDGARNGSGKTTIIQGLSYALFGSAINQIKKDNLINRTNQKNMVVSVDFSINNIDYKIVRGRKPNILKFYVNNKEQEFTDDSQGDSRETQDAIENILNMSPDMFRQIIALNTYNEPFLAMKISDQRMLIEQLLGITLLSEKADAIKNQIKKTKEDIVKEEFHIKSIESANQKIKEQIDSLKKRQKLWNTKHNDDMDKLISEYQNLTKIDIQEELKAHKDLAIYNANLEKLQRYNSLLTKQKAWLDKKNEEINVLNDQYRKLSKIDIEKELVAHEQLKLYNTKVSELDNIQKSIKQLKIDIAKETKNISKLLDELKLLKEHKCYACGQDVHDDGHQALLTKKLNSLSESENNKQVLDKQLIELENKMFVLPSKPKTHYSDELLALKHSNDLLNVKNSIEEKSNIVDPYIEQLEENHIIDNLVKPNTHYDTEEDAIKHNEKIFSLENQITQKSNEIDPYSDQIHDMENNALQIVSFDDLNNHTKLLQHQEYLLDLLTNKKSFVRKKIIDQNLNYLNNRLSYYLEKMGLPHQVVFQNDLSVEITELGRDLDFHNLSRGEMNRVVLSLSFAFRDVWESLYKPVNVLFIDELIDSGMDTVGTENSLSLLKDLSRRRQKSIWLVSHKDELTNRVDSVLKVIKEGGFTSYNTNTEYSEL